MPVLKLNHLEFIAYHGYYPEERVLGGRFEVDVAVQFQLTDNLQADELENTVNYEELYAIISGHMKIPRKLIETTGMAILRQICEKWPYLTEAELSVRKLSPVIQGKAGSSEFIIRKSELYPPEKEDDPRK